MWLSWIGFCSASKRWLTLGLGAVSECCQNKGERWLTMELCHRTSHFRNWHITKYKHINWHFYSHSIYLHLKWYPTSKLRPHQPLTHICPTPSPLLVWGCLPTFPPSPVPLLQHPPILGHQTSPEPRASPLPIAVRQGCSLLHMHLEP